MGYGGIVTKIGHLIDLDKHWIKFGFGQTMDKIEITQFSANSGPWAISNDPWPAHGPLPAHGPWPADGPWPTVC